MAEAIFIFNSTSTIIQCQKDDLMKDICQNFLTKADKKIDECYFLYDGNKINYNLTFNEQINEVDKASGKMKILAFSNESINYNIDKKIVTSKEIICPECGENCLLNINDYKITLYECKNRHKLNNILLQEYNNTQNVDQSKIICDNCKDVNKSISYDNKFYLCVSCKQNLCPLCKTTHNAQHKIIDYEKKNYLCNIHNEKYSSYCVKCKSNLCMYCESKHENHSKIIYYKNIFPKIEIVKNQINELRIKIDNFNEKIKEITDKLNDISKNLEIYYNINYNTTKNYEEKNINYQLLKNTNEFINNNYKILDGINKVINHNEIIVLPEILIIIIDKQFLLFGLN